MNERALTLSIAEDIVARLDRLARETGRSADQLTDESWKAGKIRHALARADAGEFATDQEMAEAFDPYRHAAEEAE